MLEQAIIMAGGEGKRLLPLTEARPKPLMPLLGEPVIGMTLHLLRRHGIRRASLTVRWMADKIMDALGDGSAYGVRLRYSREQEPMGTAGGVRLAAKDMTGTLLVMSGDGLTDFDLAELYQAHIAAGNPMSMVVKRIKGDVSAYGVCQTADGLLTGFCEKQPGVEGGTINTGIYFIERELLDLIPEGKHYDFACDLIPELLNLGIKINALEAYGYWCDIGSRDAYHQAQMDLLAGRVGLPVEGTRMGHAIVAPGCRIEPHVRVTGRCYIGRGSHVGRGTVLGKGTILNSGVHIGRNVRLENTTLWEKSRLDSGTVLRNVVVIPENGQPGLQRLVLCGSSDTRIS